MLCVGLTIPVLVDPMRTALILIFCLAGLANGKDESNGSLARSLYEGNMHHLRELHGLSFELSTTHFIEGDSYESLASVIPGGFPESSFLYRAPTAFKETLAIKFVPKDVVFPWRFRWTCEDVEELPYDFLRQRAFYVITDDNTHTLSRPSWKEVRDRQFTAHEDFFQHLTAGAGEIPLNLNYVLIEFSTTSYALVAEALCAHYLNGLHRDPFGKWGEPVEKAGSNVSIKRVTRFGRECFSIEPADEPTTSEIKALLDKSKSSMVILGSPDFTVIEKRQWEMTVRGWQQVEYFEAKELGSFDGIIFPKSGVVKKQAFRPTEKGELWMGVVEFKVDSVGRISTETEKHWLPDLPKEGYCYTKNNAVECTPFSRETRSSYFFSDMNTSRVNAPKSNWLWGKVMACFGMLALLTIYFLGRYRRNRS